MAAMKLHGHALSTCTQRALACFYEKELDVEFAPVDLSTGEQKKEPVISINPFGKVPCFEHGDIKMFGKISVLLAESRAITGYIAKEYPDKGAQLVYTSGKDLQTYLIWLEIEAHHFVSCAQPLVWELFYKPLLGLPQDTAAIEELEAKVDKVLDVYEKRLAESKYLAGDSFTLVDLHHLPNISALMRTPGKKLLDARPHVSKWAADITSRPAWAKVLALQDKK
uniref:glutathione transferase n=1 Tax=Turnera subulata TaxID=218843 RepID=A0A9Q0FCA4_9ROSI